MFLIEGTLVIKIFVFPHRLFFSHFLNYFLGLWKERGPN